MVSKVDLHIHSTASDGRLSPTEVIHKSAESGLTVIALADHDTVDGIAPALENGAVMSIFYTIMVYFYAKWQYKGILPLY